MYGVVHQTAICNQFNWPWLIFPAVLLVATAILFLLTTIVRRFDARHLPVWGTSLLPLLFYGLGNRGVVSESEERETETDSGDRSVRMMSRGELGKIAEKTTVRFRRNVNGGGFEEVER